MEEECLLIRMGQVASSIIIALYIAILLTTMEEECTLTYMKELVELSIVTALYTIIMLKMMEEECILISMKEEVELSFVTVESQKYSYLGSGLYLRSLHATLTSSNFYFQNVLFHFNKATNNLAVYRKIYQSAVVLFNIVNVIFEQIEVSNHNTSGLVCFNSQITFDGDSIFLNNFGIYDGGIACMSLPNYY